MGFKLPFLDEHSWPKKAKISGESKYGFSEDDELRESACKELIAAAHSHDHKAFMRALEAIIEIMRSKNAVHDSLEDATQS